jgi:uncharacterized repeat protein (TIGR01451 family)
MQSARTGNWLQFDWLVSTSKRIYGMKNLLKQRGISICLTVMVLLAVVLSALGLAQPAGASYYTVLDQFGTAAYNNNDGSTSWSTAWTETNDDNSAAAGNVRILAGELQVCSTCVISPDADLEAVQRSVNLSSATSNTQAFLSYSFRTVNLATGDQMVVEMSANGTTWTTLETISSTNASGTHTWDITAYKAATTTLRFRISAGFAATTKAAYFDNVQITYNTTSVHTSNSVLPYIQVYYLPTPEYQVLSALSAINAAAVSPTYFYGSITIVANNTIIYYDNWEDGYESKVNDPQQGTSEIWGDNDPTNGIPPGFKTDVLYAGDMIILQNPVVTTTTSTSSTTIKFDGGDKLAATEAIAVTRTSWASGAGTLHAGSEEVLDTSAWGTVYDIPVATSVNSYDFTYTGIAIMASQDGTNVTVTNAAGTTIATSTNMTQGQSYLYVNAAALGYRITANYPVQATMLTGDIGSSYESDFFTLYPNNLLSNNYYALVPGFTTSGGNRAVVTAVYLYNPSSSAITVHWTTTAGAQSDISVPARGAYRQVMPTTSTASGSGAHFFTDSTSNVFSAISIVDSGYYNYDWGYTLVPDLELTQQVKVGWGPGRDPTSSTNLTENGSPVWVTPVASGNVNVCVDYNGDDQGAYVDPNGHHYDTVLTLVPLTSTKIFDPDGDQTGMLVYLCNGSQNTPTNKIAAAWGEDPLTASYGAPGIDVGTTVPPLPTFTAVKGAQLIIDLNRDGKFDVGETFQYQIRIDNTGALPVGENAITAQDIIPQYTTYVPNTTKFYSSETGITTSIPDNSVPPKSTLFPMDEGGYLIGQVLNIKQYFMVTFEVKIDASVPTSTLIQNQAQVNGLNLTYNPSVKIVVQPPDTSTRIGDTVWLDINGNGLQDAGEPGLPGVTVELHNSGCTNTLCATSVTDANGLYGFPNLLLGATYTVTVRASTLPAGLTQTGDPDGIVDGQNTVTLTSANTPYVIADFGYQGNVSIGDFVWNDINRNGLQDGGSEVGLDGVTVNLTWAGLDGSLATTSDNLTFSQVTSGGGAYNFTGLPAGTYQVNLDTNTLPSGYLMTTSSPLTLTNLAAGTHITTADFGAAAGATIGDYVWNDMNADGDQNTNESGLPGIRVYIDSNGDESYQVGEPQAVTDASGHYLINGLTAETYAVRVDANTVPGGYSLTTNNISLSVTLEAGQNYTSADFGYKVNALVITKTSSAGGKVAPNGDITYTMTVTNNSGAIQTGITVSDSAPAGTSYKANTTIATGYVPSSFYYLDDFQTGTVYNGSGAGSAAWGDNWSELNDSPNGGATTGYIRVVAGSAACPSGAGNCLQIRPYLANLRISRPANMSTCYSGTLSYTYNNTINNTAVVAARIYVGGTQQGSDLATYSSAVNTGVSSASFNLTAAQMVASTEVRFVVTTSNTGTRYLYIDDVRFTCNTDNVATKTNAVSGGTLSSGNPPSLTLSGDNFMLMNGQSMTVQYQAHVTSPVSPVSRMSIDNTAQVTSNEQNSPQFAYASDNLTGTLIIVEDSLPNDAQDFTYVTSGTDLSNFILDDDSDATNLNTKTFANLNAGVEYDVTQAIPANWDLTNIVCSGATNSAVTIGAVGAFNAGDTSINVNLAAGETVICTYTNTKRAVISDFVWNDLNGNGLQDSGEPGILGATVKLYNSTGTTLLQTTTTTAGGLYSFTVKPDTYLIQFDTPSGYVHTLANQGANDAIDSDASASNGRTSAVTVTAGQTDSTWDAGFYLPANITGQVRYDANNNALLSDVESGIANVTVTLKQGATTIATTTTDASGNYTFTNLAPGTYTVVETNPAGYVSTNDKDGNATLDVVAVTLVSGTNNSGNDFLDTNVTTVSGQVRDDTNGNGLLSDVESGIANVTVTLKQGATTLATTTTDASGNYSFTNVAPGSYTVVETNPSGYVSTNDKDGNATLDVIAVTVLVSTPNTANDFLDYQPAAIGDLVWYDLNGDGIQNAGEPGINNVLVTLYGSDGTTVVATTNTNASGGYSFNVPAGIYVVGFTAPTGYDFSLKDAISDDADSDADTTTGKTGQYTLVAGAANTTIDAGMYMADWGDAPATYGTTGASAPRNILFPDTNGDGYPNSLGNGTPAIWLGPSINTEGNGQPSVDANTDSYDDGVSLHESEKWYEGSDGGSIDVTFSSSASGANSGYLVVWFDWNHDGVFDASEAVVNQAVSWSGTSSGDPQNLSFNIPTGGLSQDLYYRARLFASAPGSPTSAFSGLYSNGETEDYYTPIGTLPVTMNYFYAERLRGTLSVDWSTGTETGNLGFNLYVDNGQGRQKINADLIPSTGFTTHDPQDYHVELSAGVLSGKPEFYLEDVDILGRTVEHGPFALGEVNGTHITAIQTDWQKIAAENARGQALANAAASNSVDQALQGRLKAASGQSKPSKAASTPKPTKTPVPTKTTKPTKTLKPSKTPTPTKTPLASLTFTPTWTFTPTFTYTPTWTYTATWTAEPTDALEPTETETLLPSDTPVPTDTDTPEPTATWTPVPSDTPTPSDTPVPADTATLEPTETNTPEPTSTDTPTPTALPAVRIGDLLVSQSGIYRVSYADLQAAGLDLAGQPATDLALKVNGAPVALLVGGGETFGVDSYIEFYGQALDTLYTNTNVYSLSLDRASAVRVNEDQTVADLNSPAVSYYMETALVDTNNNYNELSTTGDPWYNARLVTYTSAKSWSFPISVDHYQNGAASATLKVNYSGGTDYEGSPDHHVVASFNGTQVADQISDGLAAGSVEVSLPAGKLVEGSNSLSLKLPADEGKPADVIYLDKYSVTYPRAFWAANGVLKFTASGSVFQVQNLAEATVEVYRLQNGELTRLDGLNVTAAGSTYTARFNGSAGPAEYYVSGASKLLKPGIRAARAALDLTSTKADYLMIAHPNFIAGLAPLVQARTAEGLTVRVVNVLDVYEQYSHGVVDPQALKQYIADAAKQMGTKYVLLVGDDTYDYKDYLKKGSISFIPSIYMAAGDLVQYAPVDPKYADVDNDNVPDLAIGRFAVRTTAELDNVVSKTLAYGDKDYGKTSVFAADWDYTDASNGLLSSMPTDWTNSTAYLDEVGLAQARAALLGSINNGVALTSFIGHTDDWEWTWDGLFNMYDGPNLTNVNRPTIVVQSGCWNNYYVNPRYTTMGDALLNGGRQGAAAMFGSTTLTLDLNEQKLGKYFLPLLTQPGLTIGRAELLAKRALAQADPTALDVLLGNGLLGDPTLRVTP